MGDFKNILRTLRTGNGYTQDELAKKLGISRSALAMYESGDREPGFEVLEAIADFFNVDIDYLLGRTQKTTMLPESVVSTEKYYLDEDAREIAQLLKDSPEYRVLFDVAKGASPETLQAAAQVLKVMKGTNQD